MGTRNRERRKAKQKMREQHRGERANAGHRRMRGDRVAGISTPDVAEALVVDAVVALHHGDAEEFERCFKLLVEGPGGADGHRLVGRAVLGCLLRDIDHAWRRGWQPADVARIVGRQHGSGHVRLAVDMIAAQMRGYAAATVDQRWEAQLTALGASVWWDHDDGYFERLCAREGLDRGAVLRCALEALCVIDTLPDLPHLCPPPGRAPRGAAQPRRAEASAADQRMLDRVRALLAKAESTEFPEEAEAFTAKAQELMARHSIDHALLAAKTGGRETPSGVRVGIDNPYEAAKALLLQNVAEANRCRTVWSKQLGFATVFGYPGDLESVELLYTSLLVQATATVVGAGSRRDNHGRSRTRSFRLSFLNAYAIRIGQRLRTATEGASRAATAAAGSDRLLPVLAARDDAVRETVETMFPEFVSHQVRISDREGWASGTAAADLASLNTRREVDDRD
jgi:hypothetical protein